MGQKTNNGKIGLSHPDENDPAAYAGCCKVLDHGRGREGGLPVHCDPQKIRDDTRSPVCLEQKLLRPISNCSCNTARGGSMTLNGTH